MANGLVIFRQTLSFSTPEALMSAPTAPKSSARSTGAAANAQPMSADSAPGTGLGAFAGVRRVPVPVNETVRSYAPGSPERKALKERLVTRSDERIAIPLVIGGKEIRPGELAQTTRPHAHQHVAAERRRAEVALAQGELPGEERVQVAARDLRREPPAQDEGTDRPPEEKAIAGALRVAGGGEEQHRRDRSRPCEASSRGVQHGILTRGRNS